MVSIIGVWRLRATGSKGKNGPEVSIHYGRRYKPDFGTE